MTINYRQKIENMKTDGYFSGVMTWMRVRGMR